MRLYICGQNSVVAVNDICPARQNLRRCGAGFRLTRLRDRQSRHSHANYTEADQKNTTHHDQAALCFAQNPLMLHLDALTAVAMFDQIRVFAGGSG